MAEIARLEARVEADTGAAVRSLRDFDNALSRSQQSAQQAAGAVERTATSTRQAEKAASAAASAHSGLDRTFGSLAKTAAAFATAQIGVSTAQAALSTAFSSTIGAAMGFQQALANVGSATGATKDQLAAMRVEALKIGADTSKSATQAAGAMGELVKAGVSVEATVGGVARTVVQLSEATGANVSEMAVLVSNAMNTFSLSAGQASDAANLIAKTANASAIDVGDFGFSLQAVGPVAKLAGLTMEDLSAAIGLLGNNALKGQDAGTSLKTMLTSLAAPSTKAAAEMQKLGINLYDATGKTLPFRDVLAQLQRALAGATDAQKAMALQTLFGQDAIRAGTILLKEGTTGWDNFLGSMKAAPDIAEQSAARLNTLSGQIEILRGTLEGIGIAIGDKALPALTALAKLVNEGLNSQTLKDMGAGALVIGQGFGVLGQTVGALATGFGALPGPMQEFIKYAVIAGTTMTALNLIMLANPAVATAAAIVAVGVASSVAAAQIQQHVDATYKLNEAQGQYAATIQGLVAQALPLYKAKLDEISKAGGTARDQAEYLRAEHEKLAVASEQVSGKLDGMARDLGKTWQEAEKTSPAFAALYNQWLSNQAGMAALRTEAQKLGVDFSMTTGGATQLTGALEKLGPSTQGAGQAAGQLDPLKTALQDLFNDAEKTTKALRDLVNPPTGVEQQVVAQLAAIEGGVKNLGAATQTTGQVREDFIGQSRELINSAGLEKDATDKANKILDDYQRGALNAKDAQEQLQKALDPSVKTLESVRDAYGATRDAIGKAAEAEIDAARGWSGSMEQRKADVQNFVDTAIGKFGEMPSAAGTAAQQTAAALNIDAQAGAAGENAGSAFAAGMSRMLRVVANAAAGLAQTATGALHGALEIGSPSKVMIEAGEDTGEGFGIGMARSFQRAAATARLWAGNVADAVNEGVADAPRTLRDMQNEVLRLDTAIARLNEELSHAEPMSAHAAAIEHDKQILEAWKGQTEASIKVLAAQKAEFEGAKRAIDGYNEAYAAYSQNRAATTAFGGGLPATAGLAGGAADILAGLEKAATDDTGASGAAITQTVLKWLDDARKAGVPFAEQVGDGIMSALAAYLANPTEANKAAVVNGLGALTEQARQQATLSGQTFGAAYVLGVIDADIAGKLGPTFAGVWAAIKRANEEGGAENIAAAGRTAAETMAAIQKALPPDLAARLGGQWWDALIAVTNERTPATEAAFMAVSERVNAATNIIPANFAKLPPQIQPIIMDIANLWDQNAISAEEAHDRVQTVLAAMPPEFAKVTPAIQATFYQLNELWKQGVIDGQTFVDRMSVVTSTLPNDIRKMSIDARVSLGLLTEAFNTNIIGPEEYQDKTSALIKVMKTDWSKYPDFVRVAILDLNNQLVNGALGPEEYGRRTSAMLEVTAGSWRKYDAQLQADLRNIAEMARQGTLAEQDALDARQDALDRAAERARKQAEEVKRLVDEVDKARQWFKEHGFDKPYDPNAIAPPAGGGGGGGGGSGINLDEWEQFMRVAAWYTRLQASVPRYNPGAGIIPAGALTGYGFPGMASGGTSAGGWTVVGEKGPELVNLPSGARVYPNSESTHAFSLDAAPPDRSWARGLSLSNYGDYPGAPSKGDPAAFTGVTVTVNINAPIYGVSDLEVAIKNGVGKALNNSFAGKF